MGERFQKQNILVVPLTLTRFPAGDAAKGFGRTKAEEKPYVAQAPEGLRGDWCVEARAKHGPINQQPRRPLRRRIV